MESKLEGTVNNFQIIDRTLDAAKQIKETGQATTAARSLSRPNYIQTRKWALHARMSHSTVCNTTFSIKKTRPTLANTYASFM